MPATKSKKTKSTKSRPPSRQPSVKTKHAAPAASPAASATSRGSHSPRRLKVPRYNSFRIGKRIKPPRPKLKDSFRLFWLSLVILKRHWKLFLGITLVYGILNVLLVRGLGGGTNLTTVKSTLDQAFKGQANKLTSGFTLFVYLLGSSGNSNSQSAGVYQFILVLVVSLALIWSLRQVYAHARIRFRDAFYKGVYPLIPFILVLLVIGLQLVPLLIGAVLYSIVSSTGIAIQGTEKALWGALFFLLSLLSIYMVCSSIFALYVSTLPDMTPLKALRSARQLVRYRRLIVLRKVLFLPLALLVLAALIMLPLIIYLTPVATWTFFILSMLGLPIIHSYMYALYRELLL